jgi:hypothetical protein
MISPEQSVEGFAAALMESKFITAKEADEVLQQWESLSLPVCFAVCMGKLAWHAHWVGTIRNARLGQWVLVADHTTNILSTDQYKEIILIEDEELVGLRFRHANGSIPEFEVSLFIEKNHDLDEGTLPLISRSLEPCSVRDSLQVKLGRTEREHRADWRCRAHPNCDTFSCVTSEYAP